MKKIDQPNVTALWQNREQNTGLPDSMHCPLAPLSYFQYNNIYILNLYNKNKYFQNLCGYIHCGIQQNSDSAYT